LKTSDLGHVRKTALPALSLRDQYGASKTHFMIGVVALVALQSDRLMVGGLLTLEESGVYFRHVFVASFVYQVFNIGSYNRLAPRVYAHVVAGQPALARAAIWREMSWLVPSTLVVLAATPFIDLSGLSRRFKGLSALSSIVPLYLAVLVFGYLVRTVADYNALLLNSIYREREIFVSQVSSAGLALASNLVLTSTFGIAGTVATVVLGASCYAGLSSLCLQRNRQLLQGITQ
ncbi:MAG TPA: hypothetical protein VD867_10755, partial [Burkholderiales bacterium]|nr:hypothetical protein [Burkholderiales bacterium]